MGHKLLSRAELKLGRVMVLDDTKAIERLVDITLKYHPRSQGFLPSHTDWTQVRQRVNLQNGQ